MITLSFAIIILVGCSAVGLALDKLVLSRQKGPLQLRLLNYWVVVESMQVIDVAPKMVSAFLSCEKRVFGPFLSLRRIFLMMIMTAGLTTAAVYIGKFFTYYSILTIAGPDPSLNDFLNLPFYERLAVTHEVAKSFLRLTLNVGEGFNYKLYLQNAFFDFLTVMVTILLLSRFKHSSHDAPKYFYVILDIIACMFFYYSCVFIAVQLDNQFNLADVNYLNFMSYFDAGNSFIQDYHFVIPMLLYSATIFFPTFTYLIFILILLMSKTSMSIGKWFALHMLELGATEDKTIFFYTGILLGMIGGMLKLVIDLEKLAV